VQDRPEVEASFDAGVPNELKSRIRFQAYDFFTPQPVKHADIYMLKNILHDWSDEWAARILKQTVPVMRPDSRIVLVEGLIPAPGAAPPSIVRMMAALDMHMLIGNAKERSIQDWGKLAKLADERLVVKTATQPPGIAFAVIEIGFAE
jgi:O-methyltransferase domain